MSNFNDLLSESELCELTRVSEKAKDRTRKTMKVLDAAGIYHWLRHDGSIGTTWHHVHNPRPGVAQNDDGIPSFGAAR